MLLNVDNFFSSFKVDFLSSESYSSFTFFKRDSFVVLFFGRSMCFSFSMNFGPCGNLEILKRFIFDLKTRLLTRLYLLSSFMFFIMLFRVFV